MNEYDPWGSVSRASGTIDPTHRFNGKELDPESGLYYYGGRYYDAEISRFISPDPFVPQAGNPQSLNRYSYVLNNPQNYTDPSGFFFKKLWKAIKKFFTVVLKAILPVVKAIAGAVMQAASNSYGTYRWGGSSQTNWGGDGNRDRDGPGSGETRQFCDCDPELGRNYWSDDDDTGVSIGNDYPGSFQVACSSCWGLFIGSADAAHRRPGHPDLMESGGNSGGGGGLRGVYVTPTPSAAPPSIYSRTPPSNGSTMTVNQALTEGAKWVGRGYKEIGPGVFRSADGLRQFRMTTSDILGRHGNRVPHVNFELFNSPLDKAPAINSHVTLKGPGIGGGFP